MDYSLFSASGNLINSYTDETEARAALQRIVDNEPGIIDEVALFVSDEDGKLMAGPIHAAPSAVR